MNQQRKADEREARKHLIMDGALSVFHNHGIDGATMEQIANEAGFGTASLYYYFPKKEDVFSAIMVKGWAQLWESCQPTIESEHSPKEKFLSILNIIANHILQERNLYSFLFTAPQHSIHFESEPWKEYQGKLYGTLQQLLDNGMEIGEFPKIESHLLFKAIGGSFHGILLMGDEQKSLTRKDIEDLFSRLLSTTGSPHA
ncbi:MAG: TetR/AcrR family transcriptional regulator [Candidatus Marinimicrobia bacterium]|nr:TetR/AcrR family transcriptional regulator [Candidatus Neomarinimicrobiota bacterium]